MHPIIIFLLANVAVPILRCLRVVWAIGHFFSGGVFKNRPVISRTIKKAKTIKLYMESNVFTPRYPNVLGVPDEDEQEVPRRSRSLSSESSVDAPSDLPSERNSARAYIEQPPYLSILLETVKEGHLFKYHG